MRLIKKSRSAGVATGVVLATFFGIMWTVQRCDGSAGAEPTARDLQDAGTSFVARRASSGRSDAATRVLPSAEPDADIATLGFETTNEYAPVANSPWSHLAEPYRQTIFTALSNIGTPKQDLFFWTIRDDAGETTILQGRVVRYEFKAVGKQRVTLMQRVSRTGRSYRLEGSVMVKYVRREIRQLHDRDREAFFDAMNTLYRMPTAQGIAIYGNEYKGIEFFVQMHLDGAGVKDCDHWHDDAGIMTHHVGYTLQFEQALQVVNPSVSIPYWEYTIESSMGYDSYGESMIFGPDWFGRASPQNSLHAIDDGRFAFLPVMQSAQEYVHNPYGLLRTPWNVDSTPYVTRHNMTNGEASANLVSCKTYSNCFSRTTLAGINNCLNGGTHGPVHVIVGGEWNDPQEAFIQKVDYAETVPLVAKYLWRKGYLRTPESCTVEEDGAGDESTCRASCPRGLYESRNMTAYDVLMDVHALYWITGFISGTLRYNREEDLFEIVGHEDDAAFQEAFWEKLLASFCDPGHVGELYTSSAPYDPLFWVIHPTAERFLSWRRIVARNGQEGYELDETWGYEHDHIVGETGTICDWSDVREGSLDMPTCFKGICGGHKGHDILPFKVKVNGQMIEMTNLDWLDFISPDNDDLPYIYNEYRWDHCSEAGYPMGTRSRD